VDDKELQLIAKEISDAIAAAIEDSPEVRECRGRIVAAGFDAGIVDLHANIQFAERMRLKHEPRQPPPKHVDERDITAFDRKWLRSVRLAYREDDNATDNDQSRR
jgi:hypothetical protein